MVTIQTYGPIITTLKMTMKKINHRSFIRDRESILKSMPENKAITVKPKK